MAEGEDQLDQAREALKTDMQEFRTLYEDVKQQLSHARRTGGNTEGLTTQMNAIADSVGTLQDIVVRVAGGEVTDDDQRYINEAIQRSSQSRTIANAKAAYRQRINNFLADAGLDWEAPELSEMRAKFDVDPLGAQDAALKVIMTQLKQQPDPTPTPEPAPASDVDAAVQAALIKHGVLKQDNGVTSVPSSSTLQPSDFRVVENTKLPLKERMAELEKLKDQYFAQASA